MGESEDFSNKSLSLGKKEQNEFMSCRIAKIEAYGDFV